MNEIQWPGAYESNEPHQLSRIHEVANEAGASYVSNMVSLIYFFYASDHSI